MATDTLVTVVTGVVMLSAVALVLYLAVKVARTPRRVMDKMYLADDTEKMCAEKGWTLIKPQTDTIFGVQTRSYQEGPVGVWISKLYPDSKRGTYAQARDAVQGTHERDGREYQFYAVECGTRTGPRLLVGTQTAGAQSNRMEFDVTLKRETGADRAANIATNRDILFENEEFNRTYTVSSPDVKRAYEVLTLKNIETITKARPTELMWHDGWVVFTRRGRMNKEAVSEILDVITSLDEQ